MSQHTLVDPVPAVRESEARGEISSIFDDIRTSLGTSSVNLIWRHLATFPGALPWCWHAITPLYRSGELGVLAREFRDGLDVPLLPKLPVEVREVFGLSTEDLARIGSTLRGYYVSCTMNILSLNALLLFMKEPHAKPALPAAVYDVEANPGEPPSMQKMARLLSPSEVPPHVADLMWRLNSLGEVGDGRILASLYRYLANWPLFLGATWMLIAPAAASGQLRGAIEQTLAEADFRTPQLVRRLHRPSTEMSNATQEAVRAALVDFGRNAIAKVIPITRTLSAVVGS